MSLTPGTRFGRYTVRRKLAEGGMAEIFLCAAEGPEGFAKEVVVKRVRPFLTDDPAFISMFIDEARLASRLTHPNVVQIFDFDRHDDTYYLAMEYVRGASLWELREKCRARGVGMPPLLVAHVGVEVARALAYAHQLADGGTPLNVVHRDVTPHNVLISYEGAVKLGDFGIARAGKASTAPGMLKGKFAYMAPEQARGERVDGRCDVFALGVVLWELLTGGRPFEAESDLGVLRAVQQRAIPPPRRLNPEVPEELDAAVMRALERDLSQRWPDAKSFGRALEQAVMNHRQTPEDTDIAAFVVEVLGPPPPTTTELPRSPAAADPAADPDPRGPGVRSESSVSGSGDAPDSSLVFESVSVPQWGVSEPTPALRRRATTDPTAGAFLIDRTWTREAPPEATAAGPSGAPAGSVDASGPATGDDAGEDATWALAREATAPVDPAGRILRMAPRPTVGRIVAVCVSALVMAGPAVFLMNRVTKDRSGTGTPTAVHTPAKEGNARDGVPPAGSTRTGATDAVLSSGAAGSAGAFSHDTSERAPSLAAQARAQELIAITDPTADSAGDPHSPVGEASSGDTADPHGRGAHPTDADVRLTGTTPQGPTAPADVSTRRAPPSRSRAPSHRSGVLVIEVFPEAQLEIDGRVHGVIRGRQSFRLPVGPHTVRLLHPHRNERFEVELRRDVPSKLRFNAFHVDPR